ncbi:MAG: ABC transporter ATP-binding protein [Marinovum sp.]|nr:ABC transporter ATP-binding protein [Marinovum sp.]GIR44755.1 MAG: ABC transporter ATP-binding protein [Paracoccaceae bacterium]
MQNILKIKNLNKNFGGVIATKNLNLSVLDGDLHAIIGPNGAGKTTLVSQIFGQVFPDSGQIFFRNIDVTKISEYKKSRLGINRTFQITSVMKSMTVSENIQLATDKIRENSLNFFSTFTNKNYVLDKIDFCLGQVGLIEANNQPVASLSHGDCRKLEIAMALASDAKLLLLDEPMAGLGPSETQEMISLLNKLKGKQTILLVEHDMDAVFALADRISVLVSGEIIATGEPNNIRRDSKVQKAYLGEA